MQAATAASVLSALKTMLAALVGWKLDKQFYASVYHGGRLRPRLLLVGPFAALRYVRTLSHGEVLRLEPSQRVIVVCLAGHVDVLHVQ